MAKANFIRLSYEAPPWVQDPGTAECWVTLQVAAQRYFRRAYSTVYKMVMNGTLKEFGFPLYYDGSRWLVKLPEPLPPDTPK